MPNKFYSFPKDVFEHYHAKIKDWVRAVLPTKTSDLTNDSDFLDQLALAGIIASNFSTSSTYAVGDYVLYNHTLYRCKTAISTAGAWDSSKWDATKTQDIFQGSAPGLVPAAESGDADKVLKGDGTWGEAGSSVRVSYNAQTEELSLDFSPPRIVNIGGRDYPYVQIGNQLWLAENLDWKWSELTVGSTSYSDSEPYANYYNNDETTYGSEGLHYGLLYNKPAEQYFVDNLQSGLGGWHVPTLSEWQTLFSQFGGTSTAGASIKSLTGWTGVNGNGDSEFNAVPSGIRAAMYYEVGTYGPMFTTEVDGSGAPNYVSPSNTASRIDTSTYGKSDQFAIRLVKNLT